MAQCLLNIPLFFMFVGLFIALFRVVGVPVFTDRRLKCLATVVFLLDIFFELIWFQDIPGMSHWYFKLNLDRY